MTLRSEIDFETDHSYKPVLDHGFVGLVDHMGSDAAIAQAARVSYGKGTKAVQSDRGLIRYLMRHEHTTPFEMCEVKFHLKLPIFVMRQLVRHRTASLNEYSARYSEITDEFYSPNPENIKPQSTANKQGRAGEYTELESANIIADQIKAWDHSYNIYQQHINDLGLARETARAILPVGGYTECYWKANLKNFLHMARLRMDSHAQWEIQEYARAMYELAKPYFPIAFEAFEDYSVNAKKISDQEYSLLKRLLKHTWNDIMSGYRTEEALCTEYNLSKRELEEFKKTWL
jgi:thymidylate synthase (FAD)